MARPRAAVTASPTIRLKKTAKINFQERNASHKMTSTPNSSEGRIAECALPDHRELVIVHRHLAGQLDLGTVFVAEFRDLPQRAGWLPSPDGLAATSEKSREGCTSIKRRSRSACTGRPETSSCQENAAVLPDSTSLKVRFGQRQWPRQLFELDLARLDAFGRKGKATSPRREGSDQMRALQ